MSLSVILLVLCAALCHASWNAMLKSSASTDRKAVLTLMTVGAGLGGLPLAILRPFPLPASWVYVALGVAVHVVYNVFLVRAYKVGDFGQSYPIARGSSPVLVSIGAALLVGESMGLWVWLGVVLISVGIFSLADLRRGMALAGPLTALTTGAFIAGYTVVDGLGARAAGDAVGYTGWLFVLDSLAMLALYWWQHRAWPRNLGARAIWTGLGGGAMSLASYGIVIWAVARAPMGTVSALRETSVLFAALLGALFLGEPLTLRRSLACVLITSGAMVLGWQH